ncbi:MAG TPA: Gfo/Idh/MocA family oxidoreductase [Roseiflexaceae bacterium]|nr:Gfo/Idh/MocA family oxidoreductase [Roseiflexaceae bacterium]
MSNPLRIGVLGLTHDHVWGNLQALQACTDAELVAVAEPHQALRDHVRQEFGCEQLYDDYSDMLDNETLDAVYVFSDNLRGAELGTLAAERGLHILIEKPMASTYAGAAQLYGAARAAGVVLMINWPILWWPAVQHALQLINAGRIGQVFQVNYRSAHGGPRELGCSTYFAEWLYDPRRNGAGALMDYCCYGAALTCALLGLPARVSAVSGRLFKPDLPSEDNAVLVMQHARAISTSTASWTQSGEMTSYEPMIYGTTGTIMVRNHGSELWLANDEHPNGIALEVPAIPAGSRDTAEYFVRHIRAGEQVRGLCSPEVGLMAQEVLEAGILAAAEERTISLPLPVSFLQ